MEGISRRYSRSHHPGDGSGALLPNRFPDLGVSGIAVLSNYVFGISPAWVILISNALLMAWAWKELSPRFVLWTAWAVVLFSLLLKAFEFVPVPLIGDKFMAAMVSGVIRGLGAGIVFRVGGSTGGLDIPGMALRKRYGIEMGQFSIYINTGILVLSFFVIGLEAAIYGAVGLYVFGIVLDNTTRAFSTAGNRPSSSPISRTKCLPTSLSPSAGGHQARRHRRVLEAAASRSHNAA